MPSSVELETPVDLRQSTPWWVRPAEASETVLWVCVVGGVVLAVARPWGGSGLVELVVIVALGVALLVVRGSLLNRMRLFLTTSEQLAVLRQIGRMEWYRRAAFVCIWLGLLLARVVEPGPLAFVANLSFVIGLALCVRLWQLGRRLPRG